jgi:hypothetical protein
MDVGGKFGYWEVSFYWRGIFIEVKEDLPQFEGVQ